MGIIKNTQVFIDNLDVNMVFNNMDHYAKICLIANYLVGLDKEINFDILCEIIMELPIKGTFDDKCEKLIRTIKDML